MIKQSPLIALLFLIALPAHAEWDGAAVQSLPYLYHEPELKADLEAMDAGLRQASVDTLRSYYLASVNQQPYVRQSFPEPLIYDDLSGQYVSVYKDIENNFLRSVGAGEDDLFSRLEREERQDFRNNLTSPDMVHLKEYSLKMPAFFLLPLTYVNYVAYATDVEAEPKHDLTERYPLAQQLAALLRLREASYGFEDDLHTISPDLVEKNLINTLTNNFTVEQLQEMLAEARSPAGQAYLRMKDRAFKNRVLRMRETYRVALAQAVDSMGNRIAALPQLNYQLIPRFGHGHGGKRKSQDHSGSPMAIYYDSGIRMGTTYCPDAHFDCQNLVPESVVEAANDCVAKRFNVQQKIMVTLDKGPGGDDPCVFPGDIEHTESWAICCVKPSDKETCGLNCTRFIRGASPVQ